MGIRNFLKINNLKIIIAVILIVGSFAIDYFYAIGPTTRNVANSVNWALTPLSMALNTIIYGPNAGPEFPNFITLIGFLLNLIWYYIISCIIVLIINKFKK